MPATSLQNGSAPVVESKPARKTAAPVQSLAAQAAARKVGKPKPVFADSPTVARFPLADGRVGCVQNQLSLGADGVTVERGPDLITIPRKNADGSESGERFPLATIQLLADGARAAGYKLV